jgi:hypothetical protein
VHSRGLSRRPSVVHPLVAALLVTVGACTHFTPYHRSDLAARIAAAAPAAIDHRVVLIGDTGAPNPDGEPVLQLLAQRVRIMPERTTIVFLGDIVYERGMPAPVTAAEKPLDAVADAIDVVLPDVLASRQEAEKQVRAQLSVVAGTKVRAVFVAGNHDWDQFEAEGGWDRILALESFIRAEAEADGVNVSLTPSGGCPGPVVVPLGKRGAVIALDTQWWIETRKDGKPTPNRNPTNCPYVTEEDVRARLLADLEAAARAGRWTIVAAHHPLDTEGPHGGFADFRSHLFPLRAIRHYLPFWLDWVPIPLLGSMSVWFRECCSPSGQDMSHRRNRHMRRSLKFTFGDAQKKGVAPLVYAAGHDHSLQVFDGSPHHTRYTLVSGMGSRSSDVGSNRRTLFAHSNPLEPGFMEIDFLRDGSARLAVWEHDGKHAEGVEVFSLLLADGPPRR